MKKVCLLTLALCAGAFAQSNTVVRWHGFQGVITAPGVDNPVGLVHSAPGPWTAQSGSAQINLNNGEGFFDIEGLVFNGGPFSGTTGPVASVIGTLVCNPGSPAGTTEADIDTPATSLSAMGNAELSFRITVPAVCNNPVFLVRAGNGRWLATATKPAASSRSDY